MCIIVRHMEAFYTITASIHLYNLITLAPMLELLGPNYDCKCILHLNYPSLCYDGSFYKTTL